MSQHNNNPITQNRKRTLLFVVVCALVVLGIIYMKKSTVDHAPLPGAEDPATVANHPVAVPDTSVDPTVMPPVADTMANTQLPDTILGRDKRSPYEAGYEDGYAAGCDDGAAGQEKATYDESSNFATAAERQTYAGGYREGYAKGFDDGKQGKQFNI